MDLPLDLLPPLILMAAASAFTFTWRRAAPTIWFILSNRARYGLLVFATALSVAYIAAFAPGPISASLAVSDSTMRLAAIGLLGLAAGLFIQASVLWYRGRSDETS